MKLDMEDIMVRPYRAPAGIRAQALAAAQEALESRPRALLCK